MGGFTVSEEWIGIEGGSGREGEEGNEGELWNCGWNVELIKKKIKKGKLVYLVYHVRGGGTLTG